MTYQPHPAAMIFPMMADSELRDLADDIQKNGLLEPILLHDGQVLDGRNRLAACGIAGVTPRFSTAEIPDGNSPTLLVISKNLYRRHLTTSQRGAIAVEIIPMLQAEAKERQREHGGTAPGRPKTLLVDLPEVMPAQESSDLRGTVREIAGKAVGVGGSTVERAAKIKEAAPEAFERVRKGETTVNRAYREGVLGEPPLQKRKLSNYTNGLMQNAARRRMIEALSQVRGLCLGLERMNADALRKGTDGKDRKDWARVASDAAKQLRAFAAMLRGEKNETVEI